MLGLWLMSNKKNIKELTMKQYKKLIQAVTKNVNIPILQNILCNDRGITASDGNIFVYIETDMFDDTNIRDLDSVILDMNPEDFIMNPEYGVYQNSLTIDTKILIDTMKQLKQYIAKNDDARPYVKGVHIQSEEYTVITATDGYKAVQIAIQNAFTSNSNTLNVFIPSKLMSVIETLDKLDNGVITIEQYDKVTVIETGNITITYKPDDYFNSYIKRVIGVKEGDKVEKITLERDITLSTLKALKSEIIAYIDTDTTIKPAQKAREKQNIVLEWNDNRVKYKYRTIQETIPFTRIILVEGIISGRIDINNFILMLNSVETDIVNIDVIGQERTLHIPDYRGKSTDVIKFVPFKLIITDNNKKLAFLLKN